MKRYSIVILFIFLTFNSCHKNMVLDLPVNHFNESYFQRHPSSVDATALFVRNNRILVIPPKNVIPKDIPYYKIPSSIENYTKLKELHIVNLFIEELPSELKKLPVLETISFSLAPNSSITKIVGVLKSCKKINKIFLIYSLIEPEKIEELKRGLPGIEIHVEPF